MRSFPPLANTTYKNKIFVFTSKLVLHLYKRKRKSFKRLLFFLQVELLLRANHSNKKADPPGENPRYYFLK